MFDAGAAVEYADLVKSKGERKAIAAVIDKLAEMGERLTPPHMKPLHGGSGLRELRPRRGASDWRLIYRRIGPGYVVLTVARHDDFTMAVGRANARVGTHLRLDWKGDKP